MDEPHRPVFSAALALAVMLLLLVNAFFSTSGFLVLDHVNLPFHEFGHLVFGIAGDWIGIWGGTVMQLIIPLGISIAFLLRGESAGALFCLSWTGENLLNISVYIADARSMALPLVGGGEHDWNIILSELGLLQHDIAIARGIRFAGWTVMLSSLFALATVNIRHRTGKEKKS